MKNQNSHEMWKNALTQTDEKYIAEGAELAPESENIRISPANEKHGTGNLGFVFAAAAAVIVSFIGVGFFLKGTGIEPLSPSAGSVGASDTITTTIATNENDEITTVVSRSENTTAAEPVSSEQYQEWLREAEEIKEDYSRQIVLKQKEITECEKLIDELKKRLETEKFEDKSDYDEIRAELHVKEFELGNLKLELEKLEADYYEQALVIENYRKSYEQSSVEKQPLTMEKLKALVSAKGKELTWSDFEPFEGKDVGSGLFIMYYEIDENYAVTVGGVPTEKPWYIRLICNKYDSVFSITDNGADGFEEFIEGFSPFDLLGDYYEGQDGLFHVSAENWTICEDYNLFREYFFGVWGDDYVIDDSEKDWVAASRSMYFDNFYKVNDNILAVVYHGFAGGELRWLDMRNPNVFYEAYGGIGDFPHGFPKNEDGAPAVFTKRKTSGVTNEPEYNYLSIYRLKELSKQYGIPLETLADIEIQDENGAVYHDSKYNFYPMYLVFESDNRLVINTEARAPYGDDGRRISLVFEKFTDKWERTVDFRWTDSTILKGNLYSQKEMPSEIVIPEGITEIGEGVFMDCTQLEKVTLPSTLKVIGKGAFKDCTNLKEINIPYGVTTIGERAFENCTSVYMVLPDTVTTIEDGAFAGCTQFDGTFKPTAFDPETMKPVTDESTVKCPVGETDDFTLVRPVDSTFITADYSGNIDKGHDGIDYAGEIGDNIYAAADGIVTAIETDYDDKGYGKYVIIDHGNGYTTCYAHMDSISVEMFDEVSAGDVIGKMGNTGWSTGPHLHFVLAKNGEDIDPHIYLDDPIQLIAPTGDVYPEDDILFGYGEYEGHKGIDYAGEKGQTVAAAANGTVSLAGWKDGYGNCVIIDHRNGYQTFYGHLDEIKVEAGETVTTGHLIGTMGSTGITTGVQLHFELLKNGENLNPADYIIK